MKDSSVKLQVRMDRQLKADAEEVFSDIGIDATTAVRLFFKKVAKTRTIPFRLRASEPEPEFSPEQEERILAAWKESLDPANLSGPYDDIDKMFEDIKNDTVVYGGS
jgi:DNA-damage-inducible protein J